MSRLRKIFLALLGLLFLVVAGTSLFLENDWQVEKPELDGALWTLSQPDTSSSVIITLKKEERAFRETVGTRRSRSGANYRTKYYSRYWLEAREAPEGKLMKRVAIASIKHEQKTPAPPVPEIVGTFPGGIWLFNHGMLELREPTTLDVVLTETRVREKSPEVSKVWPSQVEKFKVSEAHGNLIFQGTDLNYYQIDSKSGSVDAADQEKLKLISNRGTVHEKFSQLRPAGKVWQLTSLSNILLSSFATPTNLWYALLSEDTLKEVGRWPRGDGRPYGDEWRSLYRVAFKLDDRGKAEIDPSRIEAVGSTKLLNAGFLQRGARAVWDVADPSSSLVVHKDNVDALAPWKLGRLTRDGNLLWSVSTGLTDIHSVADAGNAAVFYGFKKDDKAKVLPGLLVFVDCKTGTAHSHDLTNLD